MWKSTLILFVTLTFVVTIAQEGELCPNNCSGGGSCKEDGCKCNLGYKGDDCSITFPDEYPALWWTFRIIVLIAYGAGFIISAIALVFNFKRQQTDMESKAFLSLFNVRGYALLSVLLLCLNMILYYGIDPEGFDKIGTARWIRLIFNQITYPFLSTMFLVILFHWAEIYYSTTKMLREAAMLEKINAKYQSNVTLEDVTAKIRFVDRLKFPFIIINILAYVVTFVQYLILALEVERTIDVIVIWVLFFIGMYGAETVGFLVFGRRLLTLMPSQLAKKMKRVTRLVIFQSSLFVFCFLLSILGYFLGGYSFGAFIGMYIVLRGAMLAVICIMLSMFVRITAKFPFIVIMETSRGVTSEIELDSQSGATQNISTSN